MLLIISLFGYFQHFSFHNKSLKKITISDAIMLLYLVPNARKLQKSGIPINIILQNDRNFDLHDFYYVQVLSPNTCNDGCSNLIGHYAVNRYTGEIWQYVTGVHLSSPLIIGEQKTLQNYYHISQHIIDYWHNIRPKY